MNEAQRFLRYVTPGLMFLAEALVLLLILLPDWTITTLKENLREHEALGVVFATLLASGGVGFVFSVMHHVVLWSWIDAEILDLSGVVARLLKLKVLELCDANTGEKLKLEEVSRIDGWVIVTSLWNIRLENSQIKAAAPQGQLMTDLTHTAGTARVATFFSFAAAMIVVASNSHFSFDIGAVARFIGAVLVFSGLFYVHHRNYKHLANLCLRYFDEVFSDVMMLEANKPVRTHVVLTDPRK